MRSVTTIRFREIYNKLPVEIQDLALENYEIWVKNRNHPSLHFKRVHTIQQIYSARVGASYRALGIKKDDYMIWFWIGNHDDYIKIIKRF